MFEADLFVRFTQCGGDGVFIAGLDASAGKTDLTAVLAQGVGAAREQDLRAAVALDQADQHGGLDVGGIRRQQVGQFRSVPPLPGGRRIQRMQGPDQSGGRYRQSSAAA